MSLSPFAKQQMLRMETYAKFPYLLEITTPDGSVFRYANSDNDISFGGETYEAAFFKLTPPERTSDGIKDATITISVLDQFWIGKIREYQERSRIRFIAVIEYDDGSHAIEKIDDVSFKLTNASWTETTVQWTMQFDDWMDINFPMVTCSSFICPGVF